MEDRDGSPSPHPYPGHLRHYDKHCLLPVVPTPGNSNKGKQQLCAMPAAALDRTHPISTFDSGAWLQAFRHHHGEQVQVGEMEERERGRTVHGLGREADMKRLGW